MAKLIPPRFPSDDPRRRAEKEFFQACRESLDDEWHVVYSLHYVGARPSRGLHRAEAETDFVLLHRSHGVLVVEVKGGRIAIQDGTWISTDARGQDHVVPNPFEQAAEAARAIHESLKQRIGDLRASKTVNHCVAFPAVSKRDVDRISTYGHSEIIILQEDLVSLSSKVSESVRFWRQSTRWSDDDFRKVKELLIPNLRTPGMSYSEYVDVLEELDKLTESQKRTIRQLMGAPGRFVVTGGAGTGKTLLGMHRAEQYASEGKRVLYVCASPGLARYLRSGIESTRPQLADHLTIDTASNFISSTARAGTRGEALKARRTKFPDLNDRYYDAVEKGKLLGRFDCLILDEAQDIRKSALEQLEFLVRPVVEGGSILILGDPNQQLRLRRADSALESRNQGLEITLDVNCRNTYEIAKVAHEFTSESVETLETRGGIKVKKIRSSEDIAASVTEQVFEIREEFNPETTVVLTLTGIDDLQGAGSLFIDGRRLESGPPATSGDQERQVPVFSVSAFQGREADAVIALIRKKSLLKTFPFKDFADGVRRDQPLMSRPSTRDDLNRVEGQFERYLLKVANEQIPDYREKLRREGLELSEERAQSLVADFERTLRLEFNPEFRDPHLERQWNWQQQRSLRIALYTMMTRARVILRIVSEADAMRFIDEQLKALGDQASTLVED